LRKIFLGYAFSLDYVRPAVEAAAAGNAEVIVASDVLRGKPLLHKIEDLMREADLCITLHNANVAAEFGIAHGKNYKYAILYCTDERLNPKPGHESSVFSDVKGWDSVLYSDAADLETQLRRYLAELLAASTPAVAAPIHIQRTPEGSASIKPRLNATAKTLQPGFIGMGGPITKIGTYKVGFEVINVGKGIANDVRLTVSGMGTIERIQAVPVGARNAVKFAWNLEEQQAYKVQVEKPVLRIEYADDDGVKYGQTGMLNVKASGDGGFLYEGSGLGPPQTIDAYSIPSD
jgi:hypothetical protein